MRGIAIFLSNINRFSPTTVLMSCGSLILTKPKHVRMIPPPQKRVLFYTLFVFYPGFEPAAPRTQRKFITRLGPQLRSWAQKRRCLWQSSA
jgi:hypothetical protein